MADTAIAITAGTGTNVDTRTEGTNGNHRQVVVLGDPATNAGVAAVDATKGLAVDLTNTGANTNPLVATQAAATIPTATTMQNAVAASANGSSLNVNGYATAVINIVSSPSMSGGTTVNFEASVDDTTWVAINGHGVGTNVTSTTTIADGDFRFNMAGYKSLRARISAYSAGTVTIKGYAVQASGVQTFVRTDPTGTTTQPVSGTVTASNAVGNVASGAADSGNPVKTGGVYNSSNITLTNGQRGDTQADVNGFVRATLATALSQALDSITAYPFGHSFIQVTADTLVKSGAGTLHGITISQADAAPTAGSIDIYDNTSAAGTKIFTHTQTTAVFMPVSLTFDAAFSTGLYIDFTTTADVSVTLIYR